MNFVDKKRHLDLKCPRCDFGNPIGVKSCRECGVDLTIACTDCGHKVGTGAKFCDECGTRLASSSQDDEMILELQPSRTPSVESKYLPSRKQMKGERKNVTILFSDISGFTQMSEKLDPEEVINLINSCFDTLTEIIYRYEGTVDKYMGDCIIALFGAPVAHEDDPERAVKAAMEIMEALEELRKTLSIPINMHVGLNTGLVVAGSIGSDLRKQYTVIGDAVNTASRIQSAAQPGQILVSESVYRCTKDVFDFAEGGEITVKGKKNPIRVYTPLDIRPRLTGFAKARARGLTPFVGRKDEMTLLKNLFIKSAKGQGQAVGISGEAGVGKSRLLYEFTRELDPDVLYLEGNCMPHGRVSPYQPFLGLLRHYLDLPEQVTEEEREDITKRLGDLNEYVSCFEDLLSLPPSDPEYFQQSPPMRRKKTFEGLIALFQQVAAAQPLVLTLDDLQWLDEPSREVISSILDEISSSRILLVLISRPEFQPPWQKHLSYTSLPLPILPRTEGKHLAQALFDAPVSLELEEFIIRRTEGNPFFVEELTRALRETQVVKCDGSYSLVVSPSKLNVPETVQGVLAARMDRLDSEIKNTLQTASVIGHEFDILVLKKVLEVKGSKLKGQLNILTRTGFIQSLSQKGKAYTFKHALTRDVAYETLLKANRRKLHRQVGDSTKEVLHGIIATQPEILAYHYTEAELLDQAIPYWQLGGEKAIQRSANVEAITYLSKGIELLKAMPDTPERAQKELALQLALGVPLIAAKGYAAVESKEVYARARELCIQVGQTRQLFPALRGLWGFYNMRSDMIHALEVGEQFLTLAQRQDNTAFLLEAHRAMGITLFGLAELTRAREHLNRGIALFDPQKHKSHAYLYGQDPSVAYLSQLACLLWILGYPDQAIDSIQQGLSRARDFAHPYSLAATLTFAAIVHQLRREVQPAREQAEAAIAISTSHGFPFILSWAVIVRGWALVEQGKVDEGIVEMHRGLSDYQATGAEFLRTDYLAMLAEAYGKRGQVDEGLNVLTEALNAATHTGERRWQAELFRLKGELILTRDKGEAEACLIQAIEIARSQKAKSLELRASKSLSRLWLVHGKREDARRLLEEIYGWFTEGFATADLQEAQVLIRSFA
jgi:class 3 adenylate cyclase/predicted ATPase